MEEKLATTVKRDKWREKNYIKALTLTRKSCEGPSHFFGLFQLSPGLTPCSLKISDFWSKNTKTLLIDLALFQSFLPSAAESNLARQLRSPLSIVVFFCNSFCGIVRNQDPFLTNGCATHAL